MEVKSCRLCQQDKPLDSFHLNNKSRDGRDPRCKECRRQDYVDNAESRRAYATKRRKTLDPATARAYHIKYMYNLDINRYNDILDTQQGKCAICGDGLTKTGHVDHDHGCCSGVKSCGKCVRGVLCASCNHLLGKANDSVIVLENAMRYLRRYKDTGDKYE